MQTAAQEDPILLVADIPTDSERLGKLDAQVLLILPHLRIRAPQTKVSMVAGRAVTIDRDAFLSIMTEQSMVCVIPTAEWSP